MWYDIFTKKTEQLKKSLHLYYTMRYIKPQNSIEYSRICTSRFLCFLPSLFHGTVLPSMPKNNTNQTKQSEKPYFCTELRNKSFSHWMLFHSEQVLRKYYIWYVVKYIFRNCLERTQQIKWEKSSACPSHSRSNSALHRPLIIYIYNGTLMYFSKLQTGIQLQKVLKSEYTFKLYNLIPPSALLY